MSRRQRPDIIYGDNGTNFTGAARLFKQLDWEKITRCSQQQRILWKFNPPTAAWGCWWKRLIGLMKGLLRRMLGHVKLTYVQLETCLCKVEAIINNRPLTCVSEDPHDLVPPTPANFLGETAKTEGCPEEAALNAASLRKSYKNFTKLREELKTRFRRSI